MTMHIQQTKKFRPHIVTVLLLLAAMCAVYGRMLGHEFLMTWDDRLYIVHNEAIQGFSLPHIKTVFSSYYVGNYAPVQMLSYMLDYELWGMKAGGFLFTNMLIHAANGLLIYRLFLRCHANRLVAGIGAAVFLLHPVQVETVAWISQRKNLLAMLFFLLAWEGYCHYREADDKKRAAYYTASVTAFILALLAKSVAVIFPLVLLGYDLCYPTHDRRLRYPDKIPFFLAALVVAALTIHSQQPIDDGWGGGSGGGVTGYHGGSAFTTFLTMLTVYCRYLGMIIWPANLCAAYEPVLHHSIDIMVIGAVLLLSGIGVLSVRIFRKNRKTGFWIAVFFIGLLPVSQIVPLVTLMNDRYLYFPMTGVAALTGCCAAALVEKLRPRPGYILPCYSLLTLLLLLLAVTSYQRVAVWRNDISLCRDTVAKSPHQYPIWEGLGEAYYFAEPQQQQEALKAFNKALEIAPANKLTLYNLGVLYLEMGDFDNSYLILGRLLSRYNDHPTAWSYLGDIYLHRKNYSDAEQSYQRALALKPDMQHAVEGLAKLAAITGRSDSVHK